MDFLRKNFTYIKMPFGRFMNEAASDQQLYLRAVSSSRPADSPADLGQDYPEIAHDFLLPDTLHFVRDNAHSSPLRISGPVTMWLHYDVMANVLCQIQGRKRLVLFPPHRVTDLFFPAGASSSSFEVFDNEGNIKAELYNLGPIVCDLHPGDVLFIPAVWPHAAFPIDGYSVAVNVFFRSLQKGYAAGRDVYANRDLQAYETGRKDVQRIVKAFKGIPPDISRFYLSRLAQELREAASSS